MRSRWAWAAFGAIALLGVRAWSGGRITIVNAAYGLNCGASAGNARTFVAEACDGRSSCRYRVDAARLGDPAVGCAKDFRVVWRCVGEEGVREAVVPPEASPRGQVTLNCAAPATPRIVVLGALVEGSNDDVTREIVTACAGTPVCTIAPAQLKAVAAEGNSAMVVRVHWRCEGEMSARTTRLASQIATTLSCR